MGRKFKATTIQLLHWLDDQILQCWPSVRFDNWLYEASLQYSRSEVEVKQDWNLRMAPNFWSAEPGEQSPTGVILTSYLSFRSALWGHFNDCHHSCCGWKARRKEEGVAPTGGSSSRLRNRKIGRPRSEDECLHGTGFRQWNSEPRKKLCLWSLQNSFRYIQIAICMQGIISAGLWQETPHKQDEYQSGSL